MSHSSEAVLPDGPEKRSFPRRSPKTLLTDAPLNRAIFTFCIPLIISNLVQVLFNMADQIVLGQMAGSTAVASVGACSNSIYVVISTLQGLSVGVTILLTRALGAEDHEQSRRIINTSILTAVGVGLLGTAIGIPLASPLLRATGCPENVFDGAMIYITIYFASASVIILYNFSAAILRSTGDSTRPSIYLILAGALNVILNVILCLILPEKVAAVAIATLVSQAFGAFLTIRRLCVIREDYRLDLRHLSFDARILRKLLRYGIPSAVNSAVYPLANLLIQTNVNSFSPILGTATAGYSAGASLNGINSAISIGFNQTTGAIVGQNIGAEKPQRVHRSIFLCMLYGTLICLAVSAVLFLFRRQILRLYLPDSEEAIEYGVIYMKNLTLFFFLPVLNNVLGSALNAYGYSLFNGLCSLIATIGFRPLYIYTIFRWYPTFDVLLRSFPISWALLLAVHAVVFAVVHIRYLHGKVRRL